MPAPLPILNHLPLTLTASRGLLGPLMVGLSYHPNRIAFGACLVFAVLSDIYDGVLARRWGIVTNMMRRLDSMVDSIFYLGTAYAAWRLYPQVFHDHLQGLVILAALELARYLFDWYKFRREASYHMWSSKFWGLCLFAGFFSLLACGVTGWPVALAIYAGIVADLEGLIISFILPESRTDVPTFIHAWRLRRTGDAAAPGRPRG